MMRLEKSQILILSLLAIAILALAAYVVRDCVATGREAAQLDEKAARVWTALDKAQAEARNTVREKLRRMDRELAQDDAEKAAELRKAAKTRRAKARRFFASRGFSASSSYMKAVEMPDGDPSEEDQEIIDLAGEAASETDLDTAADVVEAALASDDPRARISAVEMLSGLGEAGLVDISEFLADPHPEVANLAADRWELGIQDLTDEREQVALAKVGFLAITDEDQLRSLGGTLMLVQDAKLAVDVLVEVIRDGAKVQREAAKAAYEGVTGDVWKDEKTAVAWLEENYTPPEPDEDGMESDGADDISETTTTQEQENEPY